MDKELENLIKEYGCFNASFNGEGWDVSVENNWSFNHEFTAKGKTFKGACSALKKKIQKENRGKK